MNFTSAFYDLLCEDEEVQSLLFDGTGVTVTYHPNRRAVSRLASELLGRTRLRDHDFARLIGAPPGAELQVSADYGELEFYIEQEEVGLEAVRIIKRTERKEREEIAPGAVMISMAGGKPEVELYNAILTVDKPGTGIGRRMVATSLRYAAEYGVDIVRTYAARGEGPGGMIGYNVWPTVGYDAPVSRSMGRRIQSRNPGIVMRAIEALLRGVERMHDTASEMGFGGSRAARQAAEYLSQFDTVSEIMADPRGRDLWRRYGVGMHMEFPLRGEEGEAAQARLDQFLKQQKARA